MTRHLKPPLRPRNGHTLVAGVVARISGCANQKEVSLDDQVDHAREIVQGLYEGQVDYRVICTKGKGEALDRPELAEIEAMLRTGELDLLLAEDIGRMVRGTEASRLCGIAVDHGTRVLAPNDCIDTDDGSWEEDVISACRDHVGANSQTSKRIKQKKMNRFKKFGGATPCEIYGYIKPPGARTFGDWRKDEGATAVFAEWFRRLRESQNCSAVADWLNREGVPTGKYTRTNKWDGAMVRRLTANPLLKGMPGRGFRHTVKRHETGRRVSEKNPDGPLHWESPHLAHVDSVDFDEVNALLTEANAGLGRKPVNGVDPLWRVPRKRTRFPGQHARCAYCGRQCVWGGNGVAENLRCKGPTAWLCWNSIAFSGPRAAAGIMAALAEELGRLDGLDAQLRELVGQAALAGGADFTRAWADLRADEADLGRRKTNLMNAIAELGPDPMIRQKLEQLEGEGRVLAGRRRDLERRAGRTPKLPGSSAELRALMEERSRGLAADSPEYGDLLRQVCPVFEVHLVRLLDGGHLLPRARVELNFAGIVPDAGHLPVFEAMLKREFTLDLFELPQREQIRPEAVRLAAEGMDQREIGRRLGVAQAVVSKAVILDRMMKERGLATPYEFVSGPPADYPKLRGHLNPKYRFEPAEGHRPPTP